MRGGAATQATEPKELTTAINYRSAYELPARLTCPIGGAPIGGIMPGGIIPGGSGVMLGGLCPIGGIPMGGK